jgi:phage shock protein B
MTADPMGFDPMSFGGVLLGLIFLVVVAPIWIVAHYLTRWRAARALSRDDERALAEVWESARRMEARIASLESILDSRTPGWRAQGGDRI